MCDLLPPRYDILLPRYDLLLPKKDLYLSTISNFVKHVRVEIESDCKTVNIPS